MSSVAFGIDVIAATPLRLSGLGRIGVVANQAACSTNGTPAVDVVYRAAQAADAAEVVAVFGPQHGYGQTEQDNMIETPSTIYTVRGKDGPAQLPLHSLYGKAREPTMDQLEGIDALVLDLQDVGCRVYTYMYTMALCMRALHKLDRPVTLLVLDRPNPLGLCQPLEAKSETGRGSWAHVAGDLMESELGTSFVGWYSLPLQHGLTMGELAKYFYHVDFTKQEVKTQLKLQVIRSPGLARSLSCAQIYARYYQSYSFFPSPNLNSVPCAYVYIATVMLEACNISEGRGTTSPFHIFGAPFFKPQLFLNFLNTAKTMIDLDGLLAVPHMYRPTFGKFHGKECSGIRMWINAAERKDKGSEDHPDVFAFGLLILTHCALRYNLNFEWRPIEDGYEYNFKDPAIDLVLGTRAWKAWLDDVQVRAKQLSTQEELNALESTILAEFIERRTASAAKTDLFYNESKPYWLYPVE